MELMKQKLPVIFKWWPNYLFFGMHELEENLPSFRQVTQWMVDLTLQQLYFD